MTYKNCVIQIWYSSNGKSKPYPQGKIYQDENGKWIYLADMEEGKRIRFCNGWAISEQILDAFSKAGIKPKIIYRWRQMDSLYIATPSLIKKKGIKRVMGSHTQYIMPISSWEVKSSGFLGSEPKNLPVWDLNKWLKGETKVSFNEDGSFNYI